MFTTHKKNNKCINKLSSEKCIGCLSCVVSCPQRAIDIKYNKHGFWIPNVNYSKCISCQMCILHCPVLQSPVLSNRPHYPIKTKVAQWNNDDKRLNCASGGIFSAIAEWFIKEEKAIIFGAKLNEDFDLEHVPLDKIASIKNIQKTKYIQSNIKNALSETKKALERKQTVLWSGTPCQIAALKSFLGKNYSTLWTIDLICMGIPSPAIFKQYIKEESALLQSEIIDFSFRNKDFGWESNAVKISLKNGSILREKASKNTFMQAIPFIIRDCCYQCQYKGLLRQGDLTIGDFWGIEHYAPQWNDSKGTSVVLINTERGEQLFSKLTTIKSDDVPLEWVFRKNPYLKTSIDKNIRMEKFYRLIKNHSVKETVQKCNIPYSFLERIKWSINRKLTRLKLNKG